MIYGNGDIASALQDRKDFIFFASGVSNSQEKRESEYDREINLLETVDARARSEGKSSGRLVYFSSLAIFTSKTRYATHKYQMESLVRHEFPSYCIVRLGNIDFGTNPHTLINYLRAHPKAEIRDEWRYICSKDEFQYWIGLIPEWNCEMNIPGRRLKVMEIYNEYVADHIR